MTNLLFHASVVLHIITAAAWFGMGLRLAGRARTVLEAGPEAASALAEDGQRSVYLMNIFIVLTLVFSYVAFFLGGGFAAYHPAYHASLTLIAILVLVHFFLIWRPWKSMVSALQNGGDAGTYRKRVAIGTGSGHLLWLVILILMFWEEFMGVL